VIRIRPAVDADAASWDAHLARTASGDFLHDWGWAQVAALDGQPQRRFVAEEDGEVVAIAAAQVRPLPLRRTFWYVPHGPVLDYGDPRAALFARWRHAPATLQVKQTRLVELDADDALLASFDKDTRYAIRRAGREGVTVEIVEDPTDETAIDRLHALVLETQQRAGFPRPPLERYRRAWHALAAGGRAAIFEARHDGELLASGMLVVEGDRSFYLFAGSRREAPGETKRYPSYLLQWEMMRSARDRGARIHDLWGIAPQGAGPEHPWYGVGLFKKGFGGRQVAWAGTWDIVVDPAVYRLRGLAARVRSAAGAAARSLSSVRR
jgi:lipid II:glycine glycyltransferase (peptidoglycan interpeptide bridge formation enzyme)